MSRNIQSIALTALLMLVTGCASQQSAPPSKPAVEQLSYDSPDAAVTALVTGVTAHDLPQLEKILGRIRAVSGVRDVIRKYNVPRAGERE